MLRVCKNKILPVLLSTLCVLPSYAGDRKPASTTAFKFPVLLCVYQTTVADEQNGLLQLVHKETSEFAYRVDSNGSSGNTSGSYEIDGTSYRVRFEARVSQNGGVGKTDTLQLHSILEKKDATGAYAQVGQKTLSGSDDEANDGTIWKNVGARVFNPDFANLKNASGKLDSEKVNVAFRDGTLMRGSLIASGPVCGLLDLQTVRHVTSHSSELADVFQKYDAAKSAQDQIAQNAIKQREAREQQAAAQPEPAPVQQPEQQQQMASDQVPPEAAGLAEVQPQAMPVQIPPQMMPPQMAQPVAEGQPELPPGAPMMVPPNNPQPDLQGQQAVLEAQRVQIEQQQEQLAQQVALQAQALQEQQQAQGQVPPNQPPSATF